MKWVYFIYFSCVKDGIRAWGNDQIELDSPVKTYAQIKLMEAILVKRYGDANYLIAFYQLLRKERL